jgi:hypothetical protein
VSTKGKKGKRSDYAKAWDKHRSHIRGVRIMYLVPFAFYAARWTLVEHLPWSIPETWLDDCTFVVMVTVAVELSYLVNRRLGLTCPRCHERFFDKGWRPVYAARECQHCGLPLWYGERDDRRARKLDLRTPELTVNYAAESMTCPHCGVLGLNFRDLGATIVCLSCGRSFEMNVRPRRGP